MDIIVIVVGCIAGLLVLFVLAMAYARIREQRRLRTTIESLELSHKRFEGLQDELEGLVIESRNDNERASRRAFTPSSSVRWVVYLASERRTLSELMYESELRHIISHKSPYSDAYCSLGDADARWQEDDDFQAEALAPLR